MDRGLVQVKTSLGWYHILLPKMEHRGQKQFVYQSKMTSCVTQALLFHFQQTGNMALFRPLRAHGVCEWYTNIDSTYKVPETFAPSRSISPSFAALTPDTDCSSWTMRIHSGNFFQKSLVLLTLKMRTGEQLPSCTMASNSVGHQATSLHTAAHTLRSKLHAQALSTQKLLITGLLFLKIFKN